MIHFLKGLIIGLVLSLLVIMLTKQPAHGANLPGRDMSQRLDGEYIPPAAYSNPHQYIYGSVSDAFLIKTPTNAVWTVVEFRPFGTPLLYHETLVLCGDKLTDIVGTQATSDSMLLMFSRSVHEVEFIKRPTEVIACHSLDGVKGFKDSK